MEKKLQINPTPDMILYLANIVGKILLKSGAEAYRVEDAITSVCKNYGLHAEPFATMTCIVCSARDEDGKLFSSVERIRGRTTNLEKINQINQLLNTLDQYSFSELSNKVEEIKKEKAYSELLTLLSYCGGAAFFSILFEGNIYDFFSSLIQGLAIYFVMTWATKLKVNNFFSIFLSSFVCGCIAILIYDLGFISGIATSIIGALMLLVPGLALTNSIRDLISGDLLSGLSRGIEAIMVAASLAIGTGLALYLFY